MSQTVSNAQVKECAGISASYASMILNGRRPCPPHVAIKVFQRTGCKIGPLKSATEPEIAAFIRLHGLDLGVGDAATDTVPAPPQSPGKSSGLTAAQQSEAA